MATGLFCLWHWQGGADAVSPLASSSDGRANASFALLHAVAVVKAGVFTMLTVVVYVFGIDFLVDSGGSDWLVWLASFTILASSFVAVTKDDLKARLAYSTISQLSYTFWERQSPPRLTQAQPYIVTAQAGKITLFFCAGAIYVRAHLTKILELDGQGEMPFYIAFFLAHSRSLAFRRLVAAGRNLSDAGRDGAGSGVCAVCSGAVIAGTYYRWSRCSARFSNQKSSRSG